MSSRPVFDTASGKSKRRHISENSVLITDTKEGANAHNNWKLMHERSEEEDVAETLGSRLSIVEHSMLARALNKLREPQKSQIEDYTKSLGRKISTLLPNYKFQERGSVFSYLVKHVSDADCHMFKKSGKILEDDRRILLRDVAMKMLEHRSSISYRKDGEDQIKLPWNDSSEDFWSNVHTRILVLKGVAKYPGGWLIPVNLTISTGDRNESKDSRMRRILEKLRAGDYAGVLQQLRGILRHNKDLRNEIASDVNEELGRLRFFAKQLQLIVEMRESSSIDEKSSDLYVRDVLGISFFAPTMLKPLHAETESILQRRAKKILNKYLEAVASSLGKSLKVEFVDACKGSGMLMPFPKHQSKVQ